MNPKVDVFIPVYQESELLEPLLERITADSYNSKEVFVVIDEPTEKSLMLAEKWSKTTNFILSNERMGKVNALNEAVKRSSGDILLFLDGDMKLGHTSSNFLKTIVDEMKNADLLDIKKKALRDSFLAKIVDYEFLATNTANWFFSRSLGKSVGINGSAFAIKRKTFEELGGFRRVISEDLDIALRAFLQGCKYKFSDKVEAFTKVPSTWKKWYNQRKRWGLGAALWIRQYYKDLAGIILRYPKVLIPAIIVVFPSLILLVMNFMIPSLLYHKSVTLFLLLLASKFGFLIHPLFFIFISALFIRSSLAILVSFVAVSIIYYLFARKLKYTFNLGGFLLFYFVLSPLWLLIVIVSLINVTIRRGEPKVDWKC